ncbi:hypothetical protein [uncultured Aquimarina sp.]|uniref:hypothetical protein n=1 Tax=uncultured Aquimarina sp. TaxID=575652 RepID=UPI0026082AA2|nr:hypothetical protein [uncultured Aquimarina sp.]
MDPINNSIKLVEGTYSPINSADVLLSLIADKIKFHNLQILSSKDKNHPQVMHAEMRIAELKASRDFVTKLILQARDQGLHMKIDGIINIEMFKQN